MPARRTSNSSVMPLAKYSCSRPAERLAKGSTASEPTPDARDFRRRPSHHAAPSAIATPMLTTATRRFVTRLDGEVAAVPGPLPGFNARANCAAVANRSAGALASALTIAASTSGGTVGRTMLTRVGASRNFRAKIASAVAPVYGGSPTNISYSTQPRLYTSLRASTSPAPLACSGLMYAGVPIVTPVAVRRSSPADVIARAMPKSANRACPPLSRMFSGLTSR